ncbi:GTPase Era [Candidatus Nitrosacidococcus sp. I8]|uniref:GTPase Era n=1 Tax=Candidatus Nitrosacidococcus sp. I8 TaxID=2942908 RepID=UPI002225BA2B|nr:GTPase Era [Candidatus Nitrosacidococcus sp. I8]CAH9019034.1 GTPase Era [Candidatus Nitrosacidococcus sp. I8]
MEKNILTSCGYVVLIGRPNVGKSSLLNRILGQKISITAYRPQTTRHRILGIKTLANTQIIYIDTPGVQKKEYRTINNYLNKVANSTLNEADIILFLVEAHRFTQDDELILETLKDIQIPILLVLNKIDRITQKHDLLPCIEFFTKKYNFKEVIPISAQKGDNLPVLERRVAELLPKRSFIYPEDQVTNCSERFLVAELIREKLTRHLGQELPYAITVSIESFEQDREICRIAAVIYVERLGQKAIVIGKQGAGLKQIGYESRVAMEKMLDSKVYLKLWVKVCEGWSDNKQLLHKLGYSNDPAYLSTII